MTASQPQVMKMYVLLHYELQLFMVLQMSINCRGAFIIGKVVVVRFYNWNMALIWNWSQLQIDFNNNRAINGTHGKETRYRCAILNKIIYFSGCIFCPAISWEILTFSCKAGLGFYEGVWNFLLSCYKCYIQLPIRLHI